MIRIIDKYGNIKNSIQSLSTNADWLAVSGPSEILNKPTSTSSFINDGADGINPYITALSVPLANSVVAGIAKLYTDLLASNTDGAVTQAAIKLVTDNKEPLVTPGTINDYYRGDKTWQPFPIATNLISGIMKMYAAYGSGTDGSIRQDFFTTEMAKKAVIGDQRTVVPVAGEYVNVTLANTNGVVVSANTLYYAGLTFLKDCVVDSVQIMSGTLSGNGDLKFGVYDSDSNLKPGNKVAECTISVVGTATIQTGVFAVPVSITKGLHWFTFARGTNGDLVTTYGVNSVTLGNFLENRGGVGDNVSRNGSYFVSNSPNTSLPSTVSTTINAGVVLPKFALLISSVS